MKENQTESEPNWRCPNKNQNLKLIRFGGQSKNISGVNMEFRKISGVDMAKTHI